MELLGFFVLSLFVLWEGVTSQDEGITGNACTIGESEEPNGGNRLAVLLDTHTQTVSLL